MGFLDPIARVFTIATDDEQINNLTPPEQIPFPDSIGPIYCFGGNLDKRRIEQGKENPCQLAAKDRYGMVGRDRLIPLSTPNDGTISEIAYGLFLWCIIGEVNEDTPVDINEVRSHQFGSYQYIIRVKPANTNGIYIADRGAYLNRKREIREAMDGNRNVYHEDEIADIDLALARTLIPISEYTGGFEQPIVLVSSSRELSLDEVGLEGCLKDDGYMLRKISELRQA